MNRTPTAVILIVIALFIAFYYSAEPTIPPPAEPTVVLKCNFHTHTSFSREIQPIATPTQVVELYHQAGYDCIAITDHDFTDGWLEAKSAAAKYDMVIVQGEEITLSNSPTMHLLALFIESRIEPEGRDDVKKYFDQIHSQGGLAIIAHPELIDLAPHTITHNWEEIVWHKCWNDPWVDGIEWFPYWWEGSTTSMILSAGKIMTYDHDYHGLLPDPPAVPTHYYTLVFATERSEAGVKQALDRRWNVCVGGRSLIGTPEAIEFYDKLISGSDSNGT